MLHYYERFCPKAVRGNIVDFLLTAGAIGIAIQENLDLRRRVGLSGRGRRRLLDGRGRPGRALGGSIYQVENAAEIDMGTTSASPATRSAASLQIPCIGKQRDGFGQGDQRPAHGDAAATASIASRSTKSSRRCARRAAT